MLSNAFFRLVSVTDRPAWGRLVMQIEVLALLLVAIGLTIMPVELLKALAVTSTGARDFAVAYRPVVALAGLLLVFAFGWLVLGLRKANREEGARPSELSGREPLETLRRAA